MLQSGRQNRVNLAQYNTATITSVKSFSAGTFLFFRLSSAVAVTICTALSLVL